MTPSSSPFAATLRALRLARTDSRTGRPLGQLEAARRIGGYQDQWCRWERGQKLPLPASLTRIAVGLGLDTDECQRLHEAWRKTALARAQSRINTGVPPAEKGRKKTSPPA